MHGGMGLGGIITNILVRVRIGQALRAGSRMIIRLSYESECYPAFTCRLGHLFLDKVLGSPSRHRRKRGGMDLLDMEG